MKTSNLILIGLTGVLLFVYSFFGNNPDLVSDSLLNFLKIAVLICGSIAIVNFLSFVIVNLWFASVQGKEASDLVKLVVALLLYGICTLIIFQLFGQDITAIFATSALITAIIGFALQSTLGNFFSGVALQIDQPFQIGDRVRIQDEEGYVASITWRATTIRTIDGMLVQIPNGLMSEEIVKIIPQDGTVRRSLEFLVSVAVPPQQVIDTVYEAILNQPHANINLAKPIRVKMWQYQLTDKSLFVTYRILYYPRNYVDGNRLTDQEILRRAWYALHRKGMGFNYFAPSHQQHLSLISSIELFRHLSLEAQNILLQHAQSLLFDIGETLNSHNLPEKTMFILVKGRIDVQQELSATAEQTNLQMFSRQSFKVFSRRPKARPAVPLEEKVVERVAFKLAQYIGPTAFSLAHEKQSSSLYWLYQQLAGEIPDFEQRQEFLKFSPAATS